MQITDIKTYLTMPIQNLPWLFVEVQTDEGITGLGECSWYGNNTVSESDRGSAELDLERTPNSSPKMPYLNSNIGWAMSVPQIRLYHIDSYKKHRIHCFEIILLFGKCDFKS
ncbi:MAG: hypothetical protein CL879_07405, partial [Dehalococcoidia bacterium]|nr:hypothetical protein [Dehalococcoidia bacterium]